MTDHFDVADRAVRAALDAGASYADARVRIGRTERLDVRNAEPELLDRTETAGVGVRALVGSSWGFAAVNDLGDTAARRVGAQATATARASTAVAGPALALADVPVREDTYETPHELDPFEVAVPDKVDLLVGVTTTMGEVATVSVARAFLRFWDTWQWLVSSQGHRIRQRLLKSGGGMDATAVGERELQRRSHPQSWGQYATGGYEVVRDFDLPAHAGRVAEEAAALLAAPECPSTTTDLVLDSSQLALQLHESVGHPVELDRILGWEAGFAGTSFLELGELGRLAYGSEVMQVVADATLPGGLATFGYDDEGTPAGRTPIVEDGTWVGVLSGRDSAHLGGLAPGGMVRAEAYDRLPIVRMTNVGLLPGEGSLEELVSGVERGVYMTTNRSWSIDDRRRNFQFGCEAAWEIEGGRFGRLLRNPTYTGITPRFWASLDGLAGPDEWAIWGVANCGKGQPVQTAGTGHMASPGRFREVRVGVRA